MEDWQQATFRALRPESGRLCGLLSQHAQVVAARNVPSLLLPATCQVCCCPQRAKLLLQCDMRASLTPAMPRRAIDNGGAACLRWLYPNMHSDAFWSQFNYATGRNTYE
jgi:hypothetical protein